MLPFSTATYTLLRSDAAATGDGYPNSAPNWIEVDSGVRGVIGRPSFSETRAGSVQTTDLLSLALDPCDLEQNDRVQDEKTLITYELVGSPFARMAFGLDHWSVSVRLVQGFTS